LTGTNQHRSQLQNEVFSLQAQYKSNSQEIKKLKTREAQNLIQWNLMMADKEAEITALTDQIESLNRVLALDQKELDLLAESEGGLLELTRDISNTSKQAKICVTCGDSVSSRLENISCQLTSLTRVVLGHVSDTCHDTVSDLSDTCDSYQAGYGHPCHLTDFRERSVMRELDDDSDDVENNRVINGDDDGDSSKGYEPSDNGCIGEDIRGRCTTSIMIQRNSQDEITTIFRRDNSCSPNAIFTLEDTCTSPIKSETSSSPLTRATVVHVYTQTDSVEATCDKCSLADKKLRELCAKLEEAKIKNDEQMTEICLLSRRVDQLQHQRCKETSAKMSGQSSFIIKDLQGQIQHLEEKNIKKDALIKKLAEVVIKVPGINMHNVVDTITSSTVRPSDRRIDFDVQTLTSFLERRKTSASASARKPSVTETLAKNPSSELSPSSSTRSSIISLVSSASSSDVMRSRM